MIERTQVGEPFTVGHIEYDYDSCHDTKVSELVGKTVVGIVVDYDPYDNNQRMSFRCSDGSTLAMWHRQNCCESVTIEDIAGDLEDLIGSPMVMAEESSSPGTNDENVSSTWTFYKFATVKGYVTVRWYGESNGYYSEAVDCDWA